MKQIKSPTKMRSSVLSVAACATLLATSSAASAHDHTDGTSPTEDISATEIQMASPSKTILDQEFNYPPGVPLIQAYAIEIPVGKQTPLHRHAIPMYVHMTSGELEVDYGSKGKRTFKAGSSYVEAIDWCHFGKALGSQPAKLLAVYLAQESPNRVKPEPCAKPD